MRSLPRCLLLAAATALLATTSAAEERYVDDRLQLGLHTEDDPASTIVELLPSGTALEVVEDSGAMVKVRLGDGREGWVDATFLVATAPGRARLEQMRTEMDALKAELAQAQAQLVEAREQAAAAGTSVPGAGDEPGDAIPSETLREMQQLVEENQRLKRSVVELEAVQRMAVERAEAAERASAERESTPRDANGNNGAGSAPLAGTGIAGWQRWQQILLASALLLAFAAGGWVVDWSVRRRHGGFRV